MANDLADRIVMLEPEVITERLSEEELARRRAEALPPAFGAVLDLVSAVLKHLPNIEVPEPPRMADFARILAALDQATGWTTLQNYMAKVKQVGMTQIEGNTLALALYYLADRGSTRPDRIAFEGSSSELLAELNGISTVRSRPRRQRPARRLCRARQEGPRDRPVVAQGRHRRARTPAHRRQAPHPRHADPTRAGHQRAGVFPSFLKERRDLPSLPSLRPETAGQPHDSTLGAAVMCRHLPSPPASLSSPERRAGDSTPVTPSDQFTAMNAARMTAVTGKRRTFQIPDRPGRRPEGADVSHLDHALRYAAIGVPIVPLFEPDDAGRCSCGNPNCSRPGKHPRNRGGLTNASTCPDIIHSWWTTWPRANIGGITGVVFDACDIDDDDGVAAVKPLLEASQGVVPLVRTGSGGWHLYFAPTGLGNRVKFLPGTDWRGAGGYVVLPPSRHASGEAYRFARAPGGALPAAPHGILRALSPPTPERPPKARLTPLAGPGRYGATALDREAERVATATEGSRNGALNRAAFKLGQLVATSQLTEEDVITELTDAALKAGLEPDEIRHTIASGLGAGQRKPRPPRG